MKVFFNVSLLKWGMKWRRFWISWWNFRVRTFKWILFVSQKYCFTLTSRFTFIFFSKWSYSQRCFGAVQICKTRPWKWQCCFALLFKYWKIQRWCTQRCFNVDFTLSDVATSYKPKEHVKTALKLLLGTSLSMLENYTDVWADTSSVLMIFPQKRGCKFN